MGLDHSIIVLQTNSFYIFIFIFSTKYVFVIFFILVQTRSSACASYYFLKVKHIKALLTCFLFNHEKNSMHIRLCFF